MRLNLGDCTPEAQSAQHREWLPACCSWPSGCEEGAVSLVRIGEEQFGTHHLDTWARTSARPQGGETGLAQVPAAQRAAEAVQSASPPAFEFSPVPDARPAPNYPHLPRPEWVPGLPTNLPTCQRGLRMRRRLAKGGGQLHYCNSPTLPPKSAKSRVAGIYSCRWILGRYVPILADWAGGKDPGRFPRLGGRHGVHRPMAHARSSFAGATGLGHRALPSLLRQIKIDLPKPCTYRNMSSIPPRDPLLPNTSPRPDNMQLRAG